MNEASEPTFPAWLVHDDGSITVVSSLVEWSCDPDLWWIDVSDFIVDQRGTRFALTPLLDSHGRPAQPPTWHAVDQVAASERVSLVLRHLAAERIDSTHFQTAVSGVSEAQLSIFTIDYLSSLDASPQSTPRA